MVFRTFVFVLGVVVAVALFAAPPSRAAGDCDANAAQPTCDVLDDCYIQGSLQMLAPPQDAVDYYRTCLFTDHDFGLVLSGAQSGVLVKARAHPLPKIYASTFWPLYCSALKRAGQRDASICERRAAQSTSRRTHHRRTHRRATPRFTG